eukprot:scaffold101420_cov84-Phaeocystis_antarctica.AAC.1
MCICYKVCNGLPWCRADMPYARPASDLKPLRHGAALDAAHIVLVEPPIRPEGVGVRGQRLGRNVLRE